MQHALHLAASARPASDYTFVDASLASLYGLPAPQVSGFVKTSLSGTTRIGACSGSRAS